MVRLQQIRALRQREVFSRTQVVIGLGGFCRHLGISNSLVAEFWAIRDGLELALQHDFLDIMIESDSLVACNMIKNAEVHRHHVLFGFVDDCRNLLTKFRQVNLDHIFREGNVVADAMSKFGLTQPPGLQFFDVPPP